MPTGYLRLQGGVILSPERTAYGVLDLLTCRLRERLSLTHYLHPGEIDTARLHHFLVVLSPDDLRGVVTAYRVGGRWPPLIIFIGAPSGADPVEYAARFPGVEIVPVAPRSIDGDPEDTLRMNLFHEIMKRLEASTGP